MQRIIGTIRRSFLIGNLTEASRLLTGGGSRWKSWRPYILGAILTIIIVTIKTAYPRLGVQPFLLASLPFIIVVLYGNWKAAAFTLLLTIFLIFYLYLPPTYSFESIQDSLLEIAVFITQGIVIILLVQRLRDTTERLHAAKNHLEDQVKERTMKLERTAGNLRLHRSRLQELNKSKDEFIAISSHELRTPATGVKQYLGMVLEGFMGKVDKKQERMLRTAYDQNEKQLKIVDSILKIASLDRGKVRIRKTAIDIGKLVDEVVDTYRAKSAIKHQNITYTPTVGAIVWADANYVAEALGAVIENAINFTPEGKKISVEIQSRKNSYVVIIKDEGVGIAKSDLQRIFDKFSRIENPLSVIAGGTGLRLYWTKKIISMNGGRLSVRSRLGAGSTFAVSLPLHNDVLK